MSQGAPFDIDVFPFDYHEPNIPFGVTFEYEQLYAGMFLQTNKSVTQIFGFINVNKQFVSLGVVCHFLAIKCMNEWLIGGFVQYSDDSLYYYIKYQTMTDGFNHIFSETIPKLGDITFVNIFLSHDNVWTAHVPGLMVDVTFHNYPTEFMALSKSLYNGNTMNGHFEFLLFGSYEESYLWGEKSAVMIRQDAPYVVIMKSSHEFTTKKNCIPQNKKGCFLCFYCID